jgi:acetyl-CoA carboxylase biotin carboxyl carrier protein
MTRVHARSVAAIARPGGEPSGDTIDLVAPSPGHFRSVLRRGETVQPGMLIGELEVLGSVSSVLAPDGARGAIVSADRELTRAPVDHGSVLFTLDPRATTGAADASAAVTTAATSGLVFKAPTSGRFYGRPSPDKPAFVTVGAELAPGTTICLLEVMKTFHRVTYGGGGLPDRARVTAVLVADGADINAGDPLLALEAL